MYHLILDLLLFIFQIGLMTGAMCIEIRFLRGCSGCIAVSLLSGRACGVDWWGCWLGGRVRMGWCGGMACCEGLDLSF